MFLFSVSSCCCVCRRGCSRPRLLCSPAEGHRAPNSCWCYPTRVARDPSTIRIPKNEVFPDKTPDVVFSFLFIFVVLVSSFSSPSLCLYNDDPITYPAFLPTTCSVSEGVRRDVPAAASVLKMAEIDLELLISVITSFVILLAPSNAISREKHNTP